MEQKQVLQKYFYKNIFLLKVFLNHITFYSKHDTDYFYYSLHESAIRFKYHYFRGNKAPEKVKQLQISTKIPHVTM